MKNKIALKLLVFFGLSLLLFALIVGLLFRPMFTKAIIDNKKADMLTRAQGLSKTLQGMLENPMTGGPGRGGMGGQGMNYAAFVRALTQSDENIWVLDENLDFLSTGMMRGRQLNYENFPPDAERLVQEVFLGKTPYSEGFSELVGQQTLTLGVPVYQGGRVVGALLLHDAVKGMDAAAAQGQNILLISAAAALALAAVPAILLSYGFTRPIRRIEAVAKRLKEGDYQAKTQVTQRDEIGELAASVDTLALQLKTAREEKDHQEQQRNDFLANISHELRTPVTVLTTSLEALRDGVVSGENEVRAYHEQMLKDTQGLQLLVNDLMELARLQNMDFPIERKEMLLHEVVNDALRGADRLASKKGITIHRELEEAPLPFAGDYARLKQMLLITLDNAVKFSEPGSEIHVLMEKDRIEIRDEGAGIPQEELAHLFDRFRTTRTAENREGSGLGLAIAREIAIRHGISLHIESKEGKGTLVRFSFKNPA